MKIGEIIKNLINDFIKFNEIFNLDKIEKKMTFRETSEIIGKAEELYENMLFYFSPELKISKEDFGLFDSNKRLAEINFKKYLVTTELRKNYYELKFQLAEIIFNVYGQF